MGDDSEDQVAQRVCARCGAGLRRGHRGGVCDACARCPPDIAEQLRAAGFFTRGPIRQALDAYDFGYLFRAVRRTAGLSQVELGEALGIDQDRISRIERGERRLKDFETIVRIATRLCISPTLLGFSADTASPAERSAPPAHNRHAESIPGASCVTPPSATDGADFLLINENPDAVIDLFDGAPVGADYVESLHATIKHLVVLDGVHGGADVAPLALRSFRRAQLILQEGCYEPASERDIEAVTAEIGELSGWLLFDAERHRESRQVNAEALTLARIAGDVSMEWFVLSNQALASVHTGRNREALRIAQAMITGQDLPRRVRALFDVRAARALAALGDSTSALRTFDRARSAFADGTTTRDPAWSWWFDERELAGHEGMIHLALGDHSQALPQLATAVERSEGREHFRWALYIHRANLLLALLRAGSWTEAERVAIDLVPMIGIIASARTEGLLRRTVAHPQARPQMPSTLSDTLDYIGNRLAER